MDNYESKKVDTYYSLIECPMLTELVRLFMIGGDIIECEDKTLPKEQHNVLEYGEIVRNPMFDIVESINGRPSDFKEQISISILDGYRVWGWGCSTLEILVKILDFMVIKGKENNFSKDCIDFSICDIANFLGLSSSRQNHLRSVLDRNLKLIVHMAITFIQDKQNDHLNFIHKGIINDYKLIDETYRIVFTKEFHKLMQDNIERYIEIPAELYSNNQISKTFGTFLYARYIYVHDNINTNMEDKNNIELCLINVYAACQEYCHMFTEESCYKELILEGFTKKMDILKDFIAYKFDGVIPKNIVEFRKSKVIVKVLRHKLRR